MFHKISASTVLSYYTDEDKEGGVWQKNSTAQWKYLAPGKSEV